MKILMINSVCGYGSTGRICTDLADVLKMQGHNVIIAYGRGSVPAKYKTIRIGSELDVKIHGVRARLFDQSGLGSKSATEKFVKWIIKLQPDVIHLHNLHGYYLHLPTLFKYLKQSNAKIIWTLHDSWAFSGHSGTCDKVECTKWKSGCGKCPLKTQYPNSIIDRSRYNWRWKKELFTGVSNLTIVTPSSWLAEEVKHSILKEYRLEVIANGIDTSVFTPKSNNVKKQLGVENKFLILGVSNVWHKYKGLDDFISLNKRIDRNNSQIILVGLSEKQKSEMPEGIIGITKTTDINELVDYYSASDVFVNLTYCDNFPTVNLEAQACGCRAITYKTGGSPESIDLRYGSIVEKGKLDQVLDEINYMKNKEFSQEERFDLVKGVRNKYDKNVVIRKYMETYT